MRFSVVNYSGRWAVWDTKTGRAAELAGSNTTELFGREAELLAKYLNDRVKGEAKPARP